MKTGQRSVASGLGVLAGLVAVTWVLSNSQTSPGWLGREIFWFLVIFLIVIPIHELGHALAGWLVGHRIRSVIIGVGPPLLAFDLVGVAVRINLLPLGGLTMGAPRGSGWLRLRLWIFAAGGPAANLLLCYLLNRFYGQAGAGAATPHRLASVASSASWTVLLLNLIPFRTAEGAGSDGYSLLTIPFWKGSQIDEARLAAESLPLIEALRRDDIEAAAPLAEAVAARFPEQRLTFSWMGSVRHHQGRQEEAIVLWHRALALAQTTRPQQVPLLKNNIAFAEAVLGDPERYPEADAFSAAAMAAHPELTPFVGTRGAVLTRLGRAAEALPLLQRAVAAATPGRSQALNRASLACALALLGRTTEAQRELDEARRLDPACPLLDAAEADLRVAPARPVEVAAPTVAPTTFAWERWGGLVRWRQLARGLAFVYTLAPLEGMTSRFSTIVIAVVVMLNPERAGLLVFGVCNLWMAVTDRSGLTATAVFATAGLLGVALAAIRPRLGPSAPSKVPLVLAWILGGLATLLTVALPLGMILRLHHARTLGLHSFRPSPSDAVALVGWGTLLLLARGRGSRLFAIVPLALALFSLSGPRAHPPTEPHFDRLPLDGAAVVWGTPRPAIALRTARIPMTKTMADPVLSPGGRAFFTRLFESAGQKKPRQEIWVRDFEGHTVTLSGIDATFIDDRRMLLVGALPDDGKGIELSEVHPFSSPTPVWSRRISEISGASVEIEPDGKTIALSGSEPDPWREVVVRTGFDADAPLRVVVIPSRYPEADLDVGVFFAPDGAVGSLVARQRAARTGANGGGPPFVRTDQADDDSDDLELWTLRPEGEVLLGAHLPHPDCLHPTVGHPVLWCPVGWGENRALLKIDPAAGRVSRVADALPKWGTPVLIAPSMMAVVSINQSGIADRLGVVNLEARRGTWLTLPEADGATAAVAGNREDRSITEPIRGALATFVQAGTGKDATLTVYEMP